MRAEKREKYRKSKGKKKSISRRDRAEIKRDIEQNRIELFNYIDFELKKIKYYKPLIDLFYLKLIELINLKYYYWNMTSKTGFKLYMSLDYIKKELYPKKDKIEVSKIVYTLCFLGIFKRLSDEEIDEEMLNNCRSYSSWRNLKYRINVYEINIYNMDLIKQRAIKFKENKLTVSAMSKELLLRTFGADMVAEIYPRQEQIEVAEDDIIYKTSTISNQKHWAVGDAFRYFIEEEKREYFNLTDIIKLFQEFEINLSKTQIERQLKKSRIELCQKYNLKLIRINNQIKEKYKINCNGYGIYYINNG